MDRTIDSELYGMCILLKNFSIALHKSENNQKLFLLKDQNIFTFNEK